MNFQTISKIFKSAIQRNTNSLLIILFGCFLIGIAWSSVLVHLNFEYADEIANINSDNSGLARAFEEHVRRAVESADETLLFLKMQYEEHGAVTRSMTDFVNKVRHGAVFNLIAMADSHGDLFLNSLNIKQQINISNREHFKFHVSNSDGGLYIAKPIITHISGTWSVLLSRRLNRPDGSFAGTVSVGMDPRYFSDYYSAPEMGKDRSIMLVGMDGIVRARRFRDQTEIGQDLSKSILIKEIQHKAVGNYEVLSLIDRIPRVSSFRVMPDYPLIVVVGDLKSTALAPFEKRKKMYYFATLFFTVFVSGFCSLLVRSESRTRLQNRLLKDELIERKRTEEDLKRSQERFRTVFENAAVGIAISGMDRIIHNCNPAMLRMLGYAENEIIGKDISFISYQNDDELNISLTDKTLTEKKNNFSMEKRYIRKDGTIIWGLLTVSFIHNSDGDPEYMVAMVNDITERKLMQEALRETEYRYRQLFAAITDGMVVHGILPDGRPGRFIEVNDVTCSRLGYSREELLSMTPEDIDAPDSSVDLIELGHKLSDGNIVTFEQTHITKDGHRIPVEITARMFDFQGKTAIMSMIRDIADLKHAMELLRSSEQRLSLHIKETPLGVIEWDTDFRVTNWNPGAEKMFGYTKAEAMGRHADMIASASVRAHMDFVFSQSLKHKLSTRNTSENVGKDGRTIICDWYNTPLKNTEENIFGFASLVNDITERKHAEQALLESEERYRGLVDYSPDGIGVLVEGKFVFINTAGFLMLGAKSKSELIGKTIMEIVHPEYRKLAQQHIGAFLVKGQPAPLHEQKLLRLDGQPIDVEIIEIPTVYSGLQASEIVIHNITERKQREKIIATYQKQLQNLMYESTLLEERERKRIADELHDSIGQNLVFSKLKLSFLRDACPSGMPQQKKLLEEIIDLINQTVEFSRSLTYELCSPVLYLAGFEAAVQWLAEQIEKNYGIACELTMGAGLAYIKGETGSLLYRTLRELVYNVIKHAQASRISITIRSISGNMEMEIVDNGVGFDPGVMKNYGLFSVTERVKYLGGSIHIKSEIGKGTHVFLTIPLHQNTKGGALT